MNTVMHTIARAPNAVYSKNDPTQFVLRKALEMFSDDDLAALEQDISVFTLREFASSRLNRLLDMSKRISDFSEGPQAVAA